MAFKDIRFPEKVQFDFEGGPEFLTLVNSTASGFEQRNQLWSQMRHKFVANHELRDKADLDAIKDFFMVVRGRAFSFRFKDWNDFEVTTRTLGVCSRLGDGGETADGVETSFQIRKQYKFGAGTAILTFNRDIYLPIDQTGLPAEEISTPEAVYLDAVAQGSGFTIARTGPAGTGGVITFDVAPANGVVVGWEGEFDVPSRFSSDFLPVTLQQFNIGSVLNAEIIEVRPEEVAT